jgi:hypothetical protein
VSLSVCAHSTARRRRRTAVVQVKVKGGGSLVYVDNEDWRDWGPDGRGRDSKVEAGLQDLGLAKTGHEYNRCNQGGGK